MRRFSYGLVTIIGGALIHLVFSRYVSFYDVSPQLLLLLTVTHGFLVGPLMAEVLGFIWGLMMDSMGVSFFGLQSLIFALGGFLAGVLRRRVAYERPTAQLFIALFTTAYYFLTQALITYLLDGQVLYMPPLKILLTTFFNVVLIMTIFWVVERWFALWQIEQEHL